MPATSTSPLAIGFLGCGAIAPAYVRNIVPHFGGVLRAAACADLDGPRAQKLAAEFGIPRVLTPEAMLADPEIAIVVNLTPAPAHFATSRQVLQAGKHLFTEKPLALDFNQGRELLDLATARGLCVAGAADTFLGAGLQEARTLLANGAIGEPVAAAAITTINRYSDEYYHKVFNGTVLDLGPYYVGALVQLLGPVRSVTGAAPLRFTPRIDPKTKLKFALERPGTAAATLQFFSGLVATLVATQDVKGYYPSVEIYGTVANLRLPDANFYTAERRLLGPGLNSVLTPGADCGFTATGRGLGVAEMAHALRHGRPPRASGQLMLHILEILLAVYQSAETGARVDLTTSAEPVAPLTNDELLAYRG